jgi:hypothetical protein
MTDKPAVRITNTLAAMTRGAPLGRIERLCECQKTVACSVLARMVGEAQDINAGYAMTIKHALDDCRAADKARIDQLVEALAGLLGIVNESQGVTGYHMNRTVAEWDEFEEVAAADAVLSQFHRKESVR